jgi:hypothetical protein
MTMVLEKNLMRDLARKLSVPFATGRESNPVTNGEIISTYVKNLKHVSTMCTSTIYDYFEHLKMNVSHFLSSHSRPDTKFPVANDCFYDASGDHKTSTSPPLMIAFCIKNVHDRTLPVTNGTESYLSVWDTKPCFTTGFATGLFSQKTSQVIGSIVVVAEFVHDRRPYIDIQTYLSKRILSILLYKCLIYI